MPRHRFKAARMASAAAMLAKPIIRPMQPADAPGLAELARSLAAELMDPQPWLGPQELARGGAGAQPWFECLLADADGRLIGDGSFCRTFELHTGHRRLWLGDLYVVRDRRRSGVACALMAEVARLAQVLGCEAICWELWRPNAIGARFYEQRGAVRDGQLVLMRPERAAIAQASARSGDAGAP